MWGNEQVRVEMQTFLQALASYTSRVASDPKVTFEEYHVSLMTLPSSGSLTAVRTTRSQRTIPLGFRS